jgi:hypothetical protein
VHHAAETGSPAHLTDQARRSWGMFTTDPFPWTDQQLTAAVDRLTELTADFEAAGRLSFTWPDTLTSTVPPATATHRRGRRGRV